MVLPFDLHHSKLILLFPLLMLSLVVVVVVVVVAQLSEEFSLPFVLCCSCFSCLSIAITSVITFLLLRLNCVLLINLFSFEAFLHI